MPADQEQVIVALSRSEELARGDLGAAFRQIVKAAATATRARRAGIWRYGEGRLLLQCMEQYDLGRHRFSRGEDLAATEFPAYFTALDTEVVIAAGNAVSDPRTRELAESYLIPHGIASMLDAPILVDGRLWGVLCQEVTGKRRRWTTADRLFARALADIAALAIGSAERRAAAAALQRSETYFRSLIENGSDLVAVVNADGTLRYGSPSGQSQLGYRPEELVGRSFFELLHPHDVSRLADGFRRLRQDPRASVQFETRVRHADGSWKWLEGVAKNLLDDQAVAGIVMSARDATERRFAEMEVRALLGVAQDVGSTLDLEELVARVEGRARDVLTSTFAATFLRGEDGRLKQFAAGDGDGPGIAAAEAPAARLLERLAKRAKPVVVERGSRRAEKAAPLPTALELERVAAAPLIVGGRSLGAFAVGRRAGEPYDEREVALLEGIAKELAAGVDAAQLYRQQREEAVFSSSLLRVGYELLAAGDQTTLLDRLCELTVEVLPADFSRTFFLDEEEGALRMVASHGDTPAEAEFFRHFRLSPQETEPMAARLDRDELVWGTPFPEIAQRFGWTTSMLVALRHRGRVVGAQTAGRRHGTGDFSAPQQRLARGIAQMASLCLQNLLLASRLESRAGG